MLSCKYNYIGDDFLVDNLFMKSLRNDKKSTRDRPTKKEREKDDHHFYDMGPSRDDEVILEGEKIDLSDPDKILETMLEKEELFDWEPDEVNAGDLSDPDGTKAKKIDIKVTAIDENNELGKTYNDNLRKIVIQYLKTISKLQQKIVSILNLVEKNKVHGKNCNLQDLSKLLSSLAHAQASMDPQLLGYMTLDDHAILQNFRAEARKR